ncbi:MAG: type II toxin-antitoxin system RelE/ParE family toxin [Dehalococcoidia bacterium]
MRWSIQTKSTSTGTRQKTNPSSLSALSPKSTSKCHCESNRLAHAGSSLSEDSQQFGVSFGRKYIQRMAILRATDIFNQLYGHHSLKLHPLKGSRAGQYSIILTGNYRLIIEKLKEDRVRIIDVEDYHGD